jgi:hypothetical protein
MEQHVKELIEIFSRYFENVPIATKNLEINDNYYITLNYASAPQSDKLNAKMVDKINDIGSMYDANFIIYYCYQNFPVIGNGRITYKLRFYWYHFQIQINFGKEILSSLYSEQQDPYSIWKFCKNENKIILQNILADLYTIIKVLKINHSHYIDKLNIVVFGGLIRDIIALNFDKNLNIDLNSKDVDVYMINSTSIIFGQRLNDQLKDSIKYSKLLDGNFSDNVDKKDGNKLNEYQILKFTFFDRKYDISYDLKSKSFRFFETLDYTVNSLYFGLDGVLKSRSDKHPVNECIRNIQNKKLIFIGKSEDDIEYRKKIMTEYGYS